MHQHNPQWQVQALHVEVVGEVLGDRPERGQIRVQIPGGALYTGDLISASALETYRACNRKWGFYAIDKISKEETVAQATGQKYHGQLEAWLTTGVPPSETRMISSGILGHFPLPRTPGVVCEGIFAWGVFEGDSTTPFAVIYGYKDVEQLGANAVVWDLKSTSGLMWIKTQAELMEDTQGCIYAVDAMLKTGYPSAELRWCYVTTKGAMEARLVQVTMRYEDAMAVLVPRIEQARQMLAVRTAVRDTRSSPVNKLELKVLQHTILTLGAEVLDSLVGIGLAPNSASCGAYGGCEYQSLCPDVRAAPGEGFMSAWRQTAIAQARGLAVGGREVPAVGTAPAPGSAAVGTAPAPGSAQCANARKDLTCDAPPNMTMHPSAPLAATGEQMSLLEDLISGTGAGAGSVGALNGTQSSKIAALAALAPRVPVMEAARAAAVPAPGPAAVAAGNPLAMKLSAVAETGGGGTGALLALLGPAVAPVAPAPVAVTPTVTPTVSKDPLHAILGTTAPAAAAPAAPAPSVASQKFVEGPFAEKIITPAGVEDVVVGLLPTGVWECTVLSSGLVRVSSSRGGSLATMQAFLAMPPAGAAPATGGAATEAPAKRGRGRPRKALSAVLDEVPAGIPAGVAVDVAAVSGVVDVQPVMPGATVVQQTAPRAVPTASASYNGTFTLYLDVLPMKGVQMESVEKFVGPARAEVEKDAGMNYRMIDYKGPGALAAQLLENIRDLRNAGQWHGEYYGMSKQLDNAVLEALVREADVVFKGVI